MGGCLSLAWSNVTNLFPSVEACPAVGGAVKCNADAKVGVPAKLLIDKASEIAAISNRIIFANTLSVLIIAF
jgi:hypothetical protein